MNCAFLSVSKSLQSINMYQWWKDNYIPCSWIYEERNQDERDQKFIAMRWNNPPFDNLYVLMAWDASLLS
jgi:hypothetical protein